MRASLRSVRDLALATVVCALLIGGVPVAAFADTTECVCNNGQLITTTRIGEDRCESACEILGGGGQIATPEDQNDDGDGDDAVVVVPPRRERGRR